MPMVVESHPILDDGSPFPTLYWLTCPILVKRVSRLESQGAMAELNERTVRDRALVERAQVAADALRARRDSHAVIGDSGSAPGGDPERVKCLHAHVAQVLVDELNPFGALALEHTGWPDCVLPCVPVSQDYVR